MSKKIRFQSLFVYIIHSLGILLYSKRAIVEELRMMTVMECPDKVPSYEKGPTAFKEKECSTLQNNATGHKCILNNAASAKKERMDQRKQK